MEKERRLRKEAHRKLDEHLSETIAAIVASEQILAKADRVRRKSSKKSHHYATILDETDDSQQHTLPDDAYPTRLVIVCNGVPTDEYMDETEWWGDYTMIQCHVREIPYHLKELEDRYPEAMIEFQLEYEFSDLISLLWKQVLKKVGRNIVLQGNEFDLCDGYTIGQMARDAKKARMELYR